MQKHSASTGRIVGPKESFTQRRKDARNFPHTHRVSSPTGEKDLSPQFCVAQSDFSGKLIQSPFSQLGRGLIRGIKPWSLCFNSFAKVRTTKTMRRLLVTWRVMCLALLMLLANVCYAQTKSLNVPVVYYKLP